MTDDLNQLPGEGNEPSVPKAVVNRLSLYLRELSHLIREGRETTNSTQLGNRLGLTDAQVRKDLAYFGQFGYPGIGYRCDELVAAIRKILGTDQAWPVCIVGLGNLGSALIGHRGFAAKGFRVVAAFDVDRSKIDQSLEGIAVYHLDQLPQVVAREKIQMGIVAVPAGAAQTVTDLLVKSGVDGILNFAPVTVTVPDAVSIVAVDLAIELEQLSFAVVNRLQNP